MQYQCCGEVFCGQEDEGLRRIRLIVAYDGTDYNGWQIQDNGVTIEGELNKALEGLLGEPVPLIGASRTDSGVHAMGNVAVFDTESKIPPEKIAIALNHYLPQDIRVQRSEEVAADFHPRFCNSRKTYEYRILESAVPVPTKTRYSYHVYRPLDLGKMREAAACLVGTHDFSAFCSAGSQVKSKVRTIDDVAVSEEPFFYGNGGRMIRIRVSGNGFLYNMVRIIAGTLVEVGLGRRTAEQLKDALVSGNRQMAGPTAPPQGLILMEIKY